MTIDIDELERRLKAATPGPWEVFDQNLVCGQDEISVCSCHHQPRWMKDKRLSLCNAAYIAAFNPVTASELIALARRVKELEAKLAAVRDPHEAARKLLGDPAKGFSVTALKGSPT